MLSGEHTLTLSAPGFLPENVALSIVAGVDEDLGTITLTPADATLTLVERTEWRERHGRWRLLRLDAPCRALKSQSAPCAATL